MTYKDQPDRWESLILAAALAVAGTLFLFDRFGSWARVSSSFSHSLLHWSPAFLLVAGISVVVADTATASTNKATRGAGHER